MTATVLAAVAAVRAASTVLDLLDLQEQRRVQRRPDVDAAATSHALLRLLLHELTGRRPATHVLTRRCPRCCGDDHGAPISPDAHVSVSRTPALVAAAVSTAGPVGIDVELTVRTGFDGFAETVLGPDERDGSLEHRATTWAAKEALMKADGRGLQVDPREVSPAPACRVPAPHGAACCLAAPYGAQVRVLDGDSLLSRAARGAVRGRPSGAAGPPPGDLPARRGQPW